MEREDLKAAIAAIVFASEEPVTVTMLALVFESAGVDKKTILKCIEEIQKTYENDSTSGLLLREVAKGYQWVTKPSTADWLAKVGAPKPKVLSQAALETLAIVAYRQPVIRPEIEEIRGVDSGGVLKTLLERGYIRIVGRREEPGNPIIYGTTPAFLELFDLKSLEELPALRSIEELAEEQRQEAQGKEWGFDEEISELIDENEEELGDALPEDIEMIQELDQSMKNLRTLEKEIFPKEKEKGETEESPIETTSAETNVVDEETTGSAK